MGGKVKPWADCKSCGRWCYNWRLEKQNGKCLCGKPLLPYKAPQQPHQPHANTLVHQNGNANNGPNKGKDKDRSVLLAEWFASMPPGTLDTKAMEQIAGITAQGLATPSAAPDPWRKVQAARAAEHQKKQQLDKAAKMHNDAILLVAERETALEHAVTEALLAEAAASEALAAYNASKGLEVCHSPEPRANPTVGVVLPPPVLELFQKADEYEEEFATDLRQTKKQVDELQAVLKTKTEEILKVAASLEEKARKAVKKRKGPTGEAVTTASASTEGAGQEAGKPTEQTGEHALEAKKLQEAEEKAAFERAFQARLAKEKSAASEARQKKEAEDKTSKSKEGKEKDGVTNTDPTPAEALQLLAGRGSSGAGAAVRPGSAGRAHRG